MEFTATMLPKTRDITHHNANLYLAITIIIVIVHVHVM